MHPVIETLLELVAADPLPASHTSSHWQRYGTETRVACRGDELILRPAGFNTVAHPRLGGRILSACERISYAPVTAGLRSFSTVWSVAKRLAAQLGGGPDFHVLKHACACSVLMDHWQRHRLSPTRIALIGDGDGFLGALLAHWRPDAVLYCIDLPKTLVFQADTHVRLHPHRKATVLSGSLPDATAETVFVHPDELETIPGEIDCAVNIASMQEMTTAQIARYFTFLRRRSGPDAHFYCVNRLQKELPGGEVTVFDEYPWHPRDEVFLHGRCPYYTHFLSSETRRHGPRVFGVRIPWINFFDGVTLHRLVRLARVA